MKQNRSKKIYGLLIISLLSLAPTMVHAGTLAGVAWTAASVGAGLGATATAIATGASIVVTSIGVQTLMEEQNNLSEANYCVSKIFGLSATGVGLLAVLGGVAGTVGLAACTLHSVVKAVENFNE